MHGKDTWRQLPLHYIIVEMLDGKGGSLTDRELYESVKMVYDIDYSEFLKTLLKLELHNIVRVNTAREGVLIVELNPRAL